MYPEDVVIIYRPTSCNYFFCSLNYLVGRIFGKMIKLGSYYGPKNEYGFHYCQNQLFLEKPLNFLLYEDTHN